MIDDNLRTVGEVAELCFPENQRFRIVPAVAIFEAKHSGFRQRRVVDLAGRLIPVDVAEWDVLRLGLGVGEDGVSLAESTRRLSWPLSRSGIPIFSRLPKASVSAIPKSIGRFPAPISIR